MAQNRTDHKKQMIRIIALAVAAVMTVTVILAAVFSQVF